MDFVDRSAYYGFFFSLSFLLFLMRQTALSLPSRWHRCRAVQNVSFSRELHDFLGQPFCPDIPNAKSPLCDERLSSHQDVSPKIAVIGLFVRLIFLFLCVALVLSPHDTGFFVEVVSRRDKSLSSKLTLCGMPRFCFSVLNCNFRVGRRASAAFRDVSWAESYRWSMITSVHFLDSSVSVSPPISKKFLPFAATLETGVAAGDGERVHK